MPTIMVRYKVKPGRTQENQELIERVFADLKRTNPAGLGYASFKLDDGVSFMHIARLTDTKDNPLTKLAAFQAFLEKHDERCEEAAVATPVTEVGSYRFFC